MTASPHICMHSGPAPHLSWKHQRSMPSLLISSKLACMALNAACRGSLSAFQGHALVADPKGSLPSPLKLCQKATLKRNLWMTMTPVCVVQQRTGYLGERNSTQPANQLQELHMRCSHGCCIAGWAEGLGLLLPGDTGPATSCSFRTLHLCKNTVTCCSAVLVTHSQAKWQPVV